MELQMQLVQAVHVLNHDAQSCNRVAANQWLVHFQQTDAAWHVATAILTADANHAHDFEVELFAAQILKRKIHSDIGTLLPDGRSALQHALLLSATKHGSGPSQLLTQICLALSALIFRSPEARSLVQQLFGSLYELQRQGTGSTAVLELLVLLPEEVTEDRSINCSINSDHRRRFSDELLSHSSSVLKFLVHLSESEGHFHGVKCKILRCLLSWVRIGCLFEIDQLAVPSHPLIAFAFSCLQDPASFSVAIEVLAEIINRHEILPPAVLPQMIIVKDTLLVPALATGNEVVIKGLTWLMAELGQAAPGLFARGTPDILSLEEALLACTRFQSSVWEISETSLPFWSALGDYLLAPDSKKQSGLVVYLPLYASLLDAILVRVQVIPQSYSEDDIDGSTGLPDGLAQFRVNLEETTSIVCRLLGPTQYVTQLLSQITLDLPIMWPVLEAQFFLLHCASDVILDGPPLDLSSLVKVFLAMNDARASETTTTTGLDLLYRSAAQVLGAFSGWICNHPTVVFPLLSFLASGLSVPLAANASAIALRRICEEIPAISSEPASLECLLWIGEGLHNFKLSLTEEEEVLCAIGRSLSMVGSSAILNDALRRLLRPTYDSLKELLIADRLKLVSAESAAVLEAAIRALHRLGTIFSQFPVLSSSSLIGEEVFVGILAQFWPLLEQMFSSAYMENNRLATAACKCIAEATKAGALACAGHCMLPLLPKITKVSSGNFICFQNHVCFLKLANTITEEHGHQKEYASLFVEMAVAFSSAESIAALSSSYACDNEPDVAEAYMNFMSTFLRSCQKGAVLAADSHVEAALNRATICCTVMHRGAALAAMSYISCVLEMVISSLKERVLVADSSSAAAVMKICSQCGESIVSGMLYALLGPSAMSRVHKATTILQQLAAICNTRSSTIGWNSLQFWIVSAIQALPTEYLRQGEAERLSATWLDALRAAASDLDAASNSEGRVSNAGYLHGDGGRSLKRVLRDFAEQHRTSLICVS